MEREDRLILLSLAAAELGYSPERLRQLIKAGKVQSERHGRFILLRESEIGRLRRELPGGYKRRALPPPLTRSRRRRSRAHRASWPDHLSVLVGDGEARAAALATVDQLSPEALTRCPWSSTCHRP
jgi:hypothetical protein